MTVVLIFQICIRETRSHLENKHDEVVGLGQRFKYMFEGLVCAFVHCDTAESRLSKLGPGRVRYLHPNPETQQTTILDLIHRVTCGFCLREGRLEPTGQMKMLCFFSLTPR